MADVKSGERFSTSLFFYKPVSDQMFKKTQLDFKNLRRIRQLLRYQNRDEINERKAQVNIRTSQCSKWERLLALSSKSYSMIYTDFEKT